MEKNKALVIDDEQIVLDSVSKILKDENYEVDVSLSGREGLNQAIQREYDIVLTDIRMPDIGGMRVLRDVKRAKPSLPVVIITGYASVKSAVQAMKLGAADYIEKPFTPDQLLKATERSLEVSNRTKSSISKIRKEREMMKEAQQLSEWPNEQVGAGRTFKGIPASPGVIEGQATVITGHTDLLRIKTDTILVYPYMSPELTTIFPWIKGVVADHGGNLASAATIAREHGIPAVVGTLAATESINDGDIICVDGTRGHVEIISRAQ